LRKNRQSKKEPGDNLMINVFRLLAMCTISVAFASSIARAQTYKQVDYPGATLTEIIGGPNLEGTSVGVWEDSSAVIHGFSLTARGRFKSFDPPGSTLTVPFFINLQGVIVGEYLDSTSVSRGFILDEGTYKVVNAPGAAGTTLTGINDLGEISGFTCSDAACGNTGNLNITHSFLRSPKGVFKFFDPPDATSSAAETVSLLGAVVGSYTDTKGELNHGYLLFLGKYTTIDFPGALGGTFPSGGNLENHIVGIYYETSSSCSADCEHAFLLHHSVFASFDYPEVGVQDTFANGINALGVIVGGFVDSSQNVHGFIRTP
jgi:hypothetical protein